MPAGQNLWPGEGDDRKPDDSLSKARYIYIYIYTHMYTFNFPQVRSGSVSERGFFMSSGGARRRCDPSFRLVLVLVSGWAFFFSDLAGCLTRTRMIWPGFVTATTTREN